MSEVMNVYRLRLLSLQGDESAARAMTVLDPVLVVAAPRPSRAIELAEARVAEAFAGVPSGFKWDVRRADGEGIIMDAY